MLPLHFLKQSINEENIATNIGASPCIDLTLIWIKPPLNINKPIASKREYRFNAIAAIISMIKGIVVSGSIENV